MNITLQNIGKRYNREWIFRGVDMIAKPGDCIAITGGNGSGKSTLLQLIAAYATPSEGFITWQIVDKVIEPENLYRHMSWAAPYVSLYDEFTLTENVQLFSKFKSLRGGIGEAQFSDIVKLTHRNRQPLKHYSSGMRQRVKLAMAILADTPLLMLDEPASHLDAENVQWFQQLLSAHCAGRIVFVASNQHQDETFLCSRYVDVEAWKVTQP